MKFLKKPWVILSLIAVLIIGSLFLSIPLRYKGAEKKLNQEVNALNLGPPFALSSSQYQHGYCFDNCPAIFQRYDFTGERQTVSAQLQDKLVDNGYEIDASTNGNILAEKGDDISLTATFTATKLDLNIYNQ